MTRPFRVRATVALIAVATLSSVAHADDQDTIDYRRFIMQSLDDQSAAIDQILQQKAPAENLATHAQILAITATMAKKAFEPKVPGGKAKPEVWSKWADFSKRLDELVVYTRAVARAAKDGVAATGPALGASHPCKDCHNNYLVQKK